MKKFLKLMTLGLVLLMALGLMAACGGGEEAEAPAADPAEASGEEVGSEEAAEPSGDHQAVEIRIPHGLTETDPVHIGFLAFQEHVEAAGLNMTVNIFPNGQLSSSDRDLIEGIQFGEFDVTSVAASNLAPTISEYYVFNANYLFDSLDDARDTLLGEKGDYLADLVMAKNTGIRPVGYFGGTMQSIWTTNREVPDLAAWANLKVRSAENPINIAELEALGATATPVAWGELYTALQQGTVDGLFSNRVTAIQTFADVLKFGTFTGHNIYLPVPIASQSFYDGLDAEQQQVFDEAMAIACDAQWAAVAELDAEILATLEQMTADGSLVYISAMEEADLAEIRTIFIDSTESMVAELCGQEILDYFRN